VSAYRQRYSPRPPAVRAAAARRQVGERPSPSSRTVADVTGTARAISFLGGAWIVVIALTPIMRFASVTIDSRISLVVLVLAAVSVLAGRVGRPFGGPLWIIAAVLVLIAGVVAGGQSNALASIRVGIEFAAIIGTVPYVLRHFAMTERNWLRNAVVGFLAVQTISAGAGILQLWLGLDFWGFAANQGRANGLSGHPNVLGIMSTIAFLVLAHILRGSKGRTAFAVILALVVNAGALLATGSLSNMLALATGAAVLLIASRSTIRTILLTTVGAVLLVPLLGVFGVSISSLTDGVESRIDVVSGQTGSQGSLEIRQQTWMSAWERIQVDPLLGAGLDSTNQAVYGTTVVHNYLLHYWYQGGMSMLVFAVIITLILVALVGRALIRGREAPQAAVITAIVTFAFTSAFYDQQHYWIPLLVAVAASGPRLSGSHTGLHGRAAPHRARSQPNRPVEDEGTP